MSRLIYIIGESGTGKSASFRNLNPKETFLINVEDKPLPFRGWKSKFKRYTNENNTGNMVSTDNTNNIISIIRYVNEKRHEIKVLIIDDFGYTFMNNFMRRAKEKGWDRFTDIAHDAYMVLENLKGLREDLFCIVTMHTEIDKFGFSKPKTIGNLIDDKVCLEGKVTCVFHTVVSDGKYKFLTNTDGSRMAKSSMGLYNELYIDNDLNQIIKDIKAYEEGEE